MNSDKEALSLLYRKVSFILFAFLVFRAGTFIPIPFIDSSTLGNFMSDNAGGLLGVLNTFAGGSLSRMSLFALSIMPYITASIIFQLVTVVYKPLSDLKKDGEKGRAKIQNYTKYFAVLLCLFQSYGVAVGLEQLRSGNMNIVTDPGLVFRLTTVICLTGGTMFLMWLGERITARGIGNGISMLIFAGIVAEFPSFAGRLLDMSSSGTASEAFIFLFFVMLISLLFIITFFEKSFRKITVHYARRAQANGVSQQQHNFIPLKINTAGVIPPIFASSFLLFPTTMVGFFDAKEDSGTSIIESVARYLAHGEPLYILLYTSIIFFFSFFYTSIVFNSEETAENLRKSGGYIQGYRPGQPTSDYFDYILTRLTTVGATYLCLVCLLPEIFITKNAIPFYLGGTSVLIIVNVVIDSLSQISMQFHTARYKNAFKSKRGKKRRMRL